MHTRYIVDLRIGLGHNYIAQQYDRSCFLLCRLSRFYVQSTKILRVR